MVEFFNSLVQANVFLSLHPEWKAVSVAAGHLSGSVLVLFEAVTTFSPQISGDIRELRVEMVPNPPKRRGRPPKVKDA